MGRVVAAVGVLLLALVAAAAGFVLAMRRKSPAVLTAVRRVNRTVFNPRQLRSAGTPGATAAVIRHRGRTSGRAYQTPVQAVATAEGFVVPLPYGTQADWLKNVLAGGSATIVSEGSEHEVNRPEVVPTDTVAGYFADGDQRTLRLFGVRECLVVRHGEGEERQAG